MKVVLPTPIETIEVKQTDDLAAVWQVNYEGDTFTEEVESQGIPLLKRHSQTGLT